MVWLSEMGTAERSELDKLAEPTFRHLRRVDFAVPMFRDLSGKSAESPLYRHASMKGEGVLLPLPARMFWMALLTDVLIIGRREQPGVKFQFYYSGIRVRNLKKSLDFYTKALGMKVVRRGTMPHGGKWVQMQGKGSGQTLELNWYPEGSRFYTEYTSGEELDHLAFRVKDVKKAYQELLSKGATPAVTPEQSKGTEVYVKDPDGIWIELLGP